MELMSAPIEILPFSKSPSLSSLEEIFFLTSSIKEFSSAEARAKFVYKYFGLYYEKFADFCWYAQVGEKSLGYCLGSPITDSSFFIYQPHLEVFNDLYAEFPAHLHINLHPDSQGLGIGKLLIEKWEEMARASGVGGMHIMTGVDARNKSFYLRQGFTKEVVRTFKGNPILFMGKKF